MLIYILAHVDNKLDFCDVKYPILLVSGLGLADHHSLYNYWGTIPDYLKEHGAPVFTANQDAFTSNVDNAIKLKYRVFEVLEKSKKDKVNIIGHSKGGIEARYMISRLEMANHVSSLTTLSSPHHGSGIADIILGRIKIGRIATARLVNIYARLVGDKRPDSLRATISVSSEGMKSFNKDVIDHPKVYYQSYAGHINKNYPNIMWRTLARLLYTVDGKNDGLVSIQSAKWGNYRGLIQSEDCDSVSHLDMVGLNTFTGVKAFDYKKWLANLVNDLKHRGF